MNLAKDSVARIVQVLRMCSNDGDVVRAHEVDSRSKCAGDRVAMHAKQLWRATMLALRGADPQGACAGVPLSCLAGLAKQAQVTARAPARHGEPRVE